MCFVLVLFYFQINQLKPYKVIFVRFGVEAPELVQLEHEIEQEERKYASLTEMQCNGNIVKPCYNTPLSTSMKARAKVSVI